MCFSKVWSLNRVINAKSTCWTNESARSNTCSCSLFIRQEQPHFKAAQPGIPSGQCCNLQADTNHTPWILHRWANLHVCMLTYRHTHTYSVLAKSHKWCVLPRSTLLQARLISRVILPSTGQDVSVSSAYMKGSKLFSSWIVPDLIKSNKKFKTFATVFCGYL